MTDESTAVLVSPRYLLNTTCKVVICRFFDFNVSLRNGVGGTICFLFHEDSQEQTGTNKDP